MSFILTALFTTSLLLVNLCASSAETKQFEGQGGEFGLMQGVVKSIIETGEPGKLKLEVYRIDPQALSQTPSQQMVTFQIDKKQAKWLSTKNIIENQSVVVGYVEKDGTKYVNYLVPSTMQRAPMGDLPRKVGYIWIGNYDAELKRWTRAMLQHPFGEELGTPEEIQKDLHYLVVGNMEMREALPPNSAEYFNSVKSLGVIRPGSKVKLLEQPVGIVRPGKTQYWARIEVVSE